METPMRTKSTTHRWASDQQSWAGPGKSGPWAAPSQRRPSAQLDPLFMSLHHGIRNTDPAPRTQTRAVVTSESPRAFALVQINPVKKKHFLTKAGQISRGGVHKCPEQNLRFTCSLLVDSGLVLNTKTGIKWSLTFYQKFL